MAYAAQGTGDHAKICRSNEKVDRVVNGSPPPLFLSVGTLDGHDLENKRIFG